MKRTVFLRTDGNYDVDEASKEAETPVLYIDPETGEEIHTLTQQQFKDDCDINTIVKRFGITGELPNGINMPLSGDFADAMTFQETMDLQVQAREAFMSLPAELRYRFADDPARLIEFLDDENNLDEARKLGIVNKPVEKTRDVLQAIDDLTKTLTTPAKT